VIAVGLAWLVLKERRRPHFWPLAGAALVAVYLVVFANAPLEPFGELEHGRWLAAVLAVGAAFLWASGTVLGRYALRDVSFVNVTVLRFTLALPVLLVILLVGDGPRGLTAYRASDIVNLLALAALPGIAAILLYYRALRSTPASIATLAETAYPVMVTLLLALPAPYGFSQRVYPLQVVGTLVFVAVVVTLNADRSAVVAPAGGGRAQAIARDRVAAGST
jgi:drug/metabolite transporter (DMT)-like permease